jgi:hypothetical protein
VLALAVLASLSVSVVVDAGLSVWRGSSAQRAVGVLPERVLLPRAPAVVTVPPRHQHPAGPVTTPTTAVPPVTASQPSAETPAAEPVHPTHPGHPAHPTHPAHPAHPTHPVHPADPAVTVALHPPLGLPTLPIPAVRAIRAHAPTAVVNRLMPRVRQLLVRPPATTAPSVSARALVAHVVHPECAEPHIRGWGAAMAAFRQH